VIILSQTTDKIQVVLTATVATNQLQCVSCWRDITAAPTYVAGRSVGNTNNTTDIDLVAAPAASTQRIIDYLSVYNADTATQTVVVKFDANGTDYILWRGEILTGERLEYENGKGWTVTTAAGLIKVQQGNVGVALSDFNVTTLASDVINDNATLNTIQDVTGLSFPVVAGEVYWFRFQIAYTAAATTTGSRWSVYGPGSPTILCYMSEYSLAATTTTRNANLTAYDLPAASNATSGTTGSNQAVVEGIIQPASDGTVIARFASEVANSAITAKAGSRVIWQRTL
jgi:hypothetical protein